MTLEAMKNQKKEDVSELESKEKQKTKQATQDEATKDKICSSFEESAEDKKMTGNHNEINEKSETISKKHEISEKKDSKDNSLNKNEKSKDENKPKEEDENKAEKFSHILNSQQKSPFLSSNFASKFSKSPFLNQNETNTKSNVEKQDSKQLEPSNTTKTEESDQTEQLDNIYNAHCTLYRFDSIKKEIESRGIGRIFINLVEETNLYRIIMIRDKVKRLGCNHYVSPSMKFIKHSKYENTCLWITTTEKCEKDVKLSPNQTFIGKFNSEEDYNRFLEQVEVAKAHNKSILEKSK